MAVDRQARDTDWDVRDVNGRGPVTWEAAATAVLMDIRRELRTLNRLLGCSNFTTIPMVLRTIRQNTGRIPARKSAKRTRATKRSSK